MKSKFYLLLICTLISCTNLVQAQNQNAARSQQRETKRIMRERYEQQLTQLKNNYDLQNNIAAENYQRDLDNIEAQNLTSSASRKLKNFVKERYNKKKKENKEKFEKQKQALKDQYNI